MAILRLLLSEPRTISSLGKILERHPAWVRHHVKALEAVGLIRVSEERTTRNYTEKFYAPTAAAFTISLIVRPEGRIVPHCRMVSDDLAVRLLAAEQTRGVRLIAAVTGSLDGLIGVRQGLADIAGCHLLDTDTGQYNLPYVEAPVPEIGTCAS
jgi:DNA-binding transcriptional ArsR family regulator